LVVTRRPLSEDRILEGNASPEATEHDGRSGYQYDLTPTHGSEVELKEPPWPELARVITAGTWIEASFTRGKGEVGMDEYQVRTWQGWHHHMDLSLIAVWFLIGDTTPRSAGVARLDPAASPLWAQWAPAGGILYA